MEARGPGGRGRLRRAPSAPWPRRALPPSRRSGLPTREGGWAACFRRREARRTAARSRAPSCRTHAACCHPAESASWCDSCQESPELSRASPLRSLSQHAQQQFRKAQRGYSVASARFSGRCSLVNCCSCRSLPAAAGRKVRSRCCPRHASAAVATLSSAVPRLPLRPARRSVHTSCRHQSFITPRCKP